VIDFVVGGERERGKAWEGKGKPRDEKYERFCQFLLIIFYEKMNFFCEGNMVDRKEKREWTVERTYDA
tara:strand:+ start:246 stop:449 length:204 start_codon:yes stop_codon:yes gene_type:complete